MAEKGSLAAPLTIGRLSFLAEVDAATVRFYERAGLLEAEERTEAGYRLYSNNSLARIQFIRRAREIGYDLDEIKLILKLHDQGGSRAEVTEFTAAMIAEVDEKLRALHKWRTLFADIAEYFEQSSADHIDSETVDTLMRGQCANSKH